MDCSGCGKRIAGTFYEAADGIALPALPSYRAIHPLAAAKFG